MLTDSNKLIHDLNSEVIALYSFVEKVSKNKILTERDMKLAALIMKDKSKCINLIVEVKNNLNSNKGKDE